MPHQCTTCGRTFPDGSKEMLSGCPDCGGNKFQFKPAGATTDEPAAEEDAFTAEDGATADDAAPDERPPRSGDPDSSDPDGVGDANDSTPADASAAADTSMPTDTDPAAPDPDPTDPTDSTTGSEHVRERSEEDVAQASARSDVVSPDELDRASHPVDSESDADTRESADPDGPRPDIGELRDELNEQFESIRIVSPGKYELNLMELYDRQEYIISLQEDGRYVIEMPDAWGIQDE